MTVRFAAQKTHILIRQLMPAALALAIASEAFAEQRFIEANGWCLSFNTDAMPDGSFVANHPSPFGMFVVPAELTGIPGTISGAETGIHVNFSKGSPADWQRRVDGRFGSGGCERRAADHRLNEVFDPGDAPCRLAPRTEYFEPASPSPLTVAARMTCATNPSVMACRVRDIYPSGWSANISLPKAELPNWETAILETRTFFHDHLRDCGD